MRIRGPRKHRSKRATFQRGPQSHRPLHAGTALGNGAAVCKIKACRSEREAYNQELNRFDRSRGDQLENLALSSVGAGRQEQGRLFGQDFVVAASSTAGEAVNGSFGEAVGGHLNSTRKCNPGVASVRSPGVQPEPSSGNN